MDIQSEFTSTNSVSTVKVYKYRWIVLGIFCLFTVINFMQFLQFSIIANTATKFYKVDNFLIDLTALIFMVIYILFFLPVSYLIEKYSLKVTAIVGTALTVAGNGVKLLCADADKFYAALIGQGLIAIAQVYMISIPSKFATVWFGPDEVSTACAIAVLGTQLGVAIGSVVPTLMIQNGDEETVSKQIFRMMLANLIATVIIFLIVIVFFRAKPKIPPSQSQLNLLMTENKPEFVNDVKKIMKDKSFLLLLVSFGLLNGIWNTFGVVINQVYIEYFPDGEQDIGYIVLISIISGGCIGSVIFGLILDKTHQFKLTSICVFIGSCLTFVFVIVILETHSRIGSFIVIPLFGFFTAASLLIGFEFAIETTYPIPESISCSVLNSIIFLVAIILTLIMEQLFVSIGYLYTCIFVLVIMIACTVNLFFMQPELKRRNANSELSSPIN